MSATDRKYAINPIWPGWYARWLCRRLGHFPWPLVSHHPEWPHICCRCGILLIHGDRIQKGQGL